MLPMLLALVHVEPDRTRRRRVRKSDSMYAVFSLFETLACENVAVCINVCDFCRLR
jgi:hypothetical protein